jgi:serine/threonine protein kinase
MSKVIGEGTYGCVHRPPLKCETGTNVDYKNKISKVMTTKDADSELSEYSLIDQADPKFKFHMTTPIECNPEKNANTLKAIDKCSESFQSRDIDKYKLLIMPDGGLDLNNYAKKTLSRKQIDIFWIEAQRIFFGLKVMKDTGLVHHDFKPHNIVYNEKNQRTNYIDFGFMKKNSEIITQCKQSIYRDGKAHWSFPYEFRFVNKDEFLDSFNKETFEGYFKNEDEQLDTFIEYVTATDERQEFKETFMKQVYLMLKYDLRSETYDAFLQKSVETIDVYGVGLSFLYVLKRFAYKMDPKIVADLNELFLNMITPRVSLRYSADVALNRYEAIIESFGLAAKYKRRFVNHELVKLAKIQPRL